MIDEAKVLRHSSGAVVLGLSVLFVVAIVCILLEDYTPLPVLLGMVAIIIIRHLELKSFIEQEKQND